MFRVSPIRPGSLQSPTPELLSIDPSSQCSFLRSNAASDPPTSVWPCIIVSACTTSSSAQPGCFLPNLVSSQQTDENHDAANDTGSDKNQAINSSSASRSHTRRSNTCSGYTGRNGRIANSTMLATRSCWCSGLHGWNRLNRGDRRVRRRGAGFALLNRLDWGDHRV